MGKSSHKSSLVGKQPHPKHKQQGGASRHGGGGGGGGAPQGQRASAFKVSSHKALKAKHKTKAVTSNLKWINSKSSKEQVSKNNATFAAVQETMTVTVKENSKQAAQQAKVGQQSTKKEPIRAQVDVDATMEQMALL